MGEESIDEHVQLLLEEERSHLRDARSSMEDKDAPRELRCLESKMRVSHEEARDRGRVQVLPCHVNGQREHERLRLREAPLALREKAEVGALHQCAQTVGETIGEDVDVLDTAFAAAEAAAEAAAARTAATDADAADAAGTASVAGSATAASATAASATAAAAAAEKTRGPCDRQRRGRRMRRRARANCP